MFLAEVSSVCVYICVYGRLVVCIVEFYEVKSRVSVLVFEIDFVSVDD